MSAQLSTVLTRLWCQLRIEDGAKAATPRSLANETYITIVLGQRLHHAGGLRGGVPLGGITIVLGQRLHHAGGSRGGVPLGGI